MKSFQRLRKVYQLTGTYPSQPNQYHSINIRILIILIILIAYFGTTFAYFLYDATEVLELATTFFQSITAVAVIFNFLVHVWKTPAAFNLIAEFDDFIAIRSENVAAKAMYCKMHEYIELMSLVMKIIQLGIIPILISVPYLLLSSINYFVYDWGNESFVLPWPVKLPFDWRTPFTYPVACGLLTSITLTICTSVLPLMIFFTGTFILFIAFLKDLSNDLNDLNEMTKKDQGIERMQTFCKLVKDSSCVKQFLSAFNDIIEFSFAILFLWSLLSMCVMLLTMQSVLVSDDWTALALPQILVYVLLSFIMIFVACEFGQWMSGRFEKFGGSLSACKWYLFTSEMQRMYLVVLVNAQQPEFVRTFGDIPCTRESFKKTTNAGFSYFMMLHRMYE